MSTSNSTSPWMLAFEGDLKGVRAALDDDPTLLTRVDEDERTLFHWACAGGKSMELLDYLVADTPDITAFVSQKDEDGVTPLHSAAGGGHVEVVKWLLKHGADPTATNDIGSIPLHYHKGNTDIAKLLVTAAISNKTSDGPSSLASCLDAQDRNGVTPCHRAIAIGSLEVAQLMVTCGANVNLQDRAGNTCLHLAFLHKQREMAEWLLSPKVAADETIRNKENKLPMECGVYKRTLIKGEIDAMEAAAAAAMEEEVQEVVAAHTTDPVEPTDEVN